MITEAFGETMVAATVGEAERVLESTQTWDAWFVDELLPDGRGMDVIARARATGSTTRAMLLTGCLDAYVANAAFDLGASYVIKPVTRLRVAQFLAGGSEFSRRLRQELERWRLLYGLTPAEVDILRQTALGESQEAIAATRGCATVTVKTQVRNLLDKTQDASRTGAAIRLLRAIAGDRVA